MTDKELLANAPKGATHVAFSNFQSAIKYLQTDTDVINCWYHWVDDTRHIVDYDFTVVFDDMRSLSDIKRLVDMESDLETQAINALF